MLLFCCYTPAHEVLYREIFLPSIPARFEVRPTVVGIEGPGDYLSDEFLRCIRAKLDLVVRSIAENLGSEIVWSDVDIRFFDLTPDRLGFKLIASRSDLLFQRETSRMPDVNTGFFVCRCTPTVLDFFRDVRAELDLHHEENEQMVVNRLLLGSDRKREHATSHPALTWNYLPLSFYARTHGWPPPRQLSLYHANYTKGPDAIGQKMAQFKEIQIVRDGGLPAFAFSVLKRVPDKFRACISSTARDT